MLEVKNLHAAYGLSQVLFGLSFTVGAGECVCLLGRNGAGKSTTLKSIMGLVPPKGASIRLGETELSGLPPYTIARMGLGYVPEDRRVFPTLSVLENLQVAGIVARKSGLGAEPWTVAKIFDLFPSLYNRRENKASTLSGGEQQMLSIARTLMTNPSLLLLDEPSEGLAPVVVELLAERIAGLLGTGLSILLSEQNLHFVTGLGKRAYVIHNGEVAFSGTMAELLQDEQVQRNYLMV